MSEELESFDSFSEGIREGIEELGWSEPMPVQRRVIPVMRSGRDLIVQAITGSGKTGGFGLPIVAHGLSRGAPATSVVALDRSGTRIA